jgi:3-hydroxyacyl-[acyl-carrier-protein] dehydratase
VEGTFVASPDDGLFEGSAVSEVLVIEAMAQIAGALVFGDDGAPGFLSAIDDARFEGTIQAGDRIELAVQLDAGFGRIHRFSGVAMREGVEFAHARFYLAGPSDETT